MNDANARTEIPAQPIEAAAKAPAPAPSPGDEFDALLREYDDTVGKTAAPAAPEPPPAPTMDEGERLAHDLDNTALRARVSQFETARRMEAVTKQAGEDEARIFSAAREAVAGFNVPEDYAEMWLGKRFRSDPEMQKAVAGWYKSKTPAAKDRAERAVNRALKELREHAKGLPDPHATADRDLVTRAVRGEGLMKAPAREKPWATMSAKEFKQATAEEFGFENSRMEG